WGRGTTVLVSRGVGHHEANGWDAVTGFGPGPSSLLPSDGGYYRHAKPIVAIRIRLLYVHSVKSVEDIWQMLSRNGVTLIHYTQGHLFALPVDLDDYRALRTRMPSRVTDEIGKRTLQ